MNWHTIILKHQMHSARDLYLDYAIDTENKVVTHKVEWIDTQLLHSWLQIHQLNRINTTLEAEGKPQLENLNGFTFKLTVKNCETEFTMQLFKSEIDWQQDTVVIKPIETNYD